jgi:hypothetical protein
MVSTSKLYRLFIIALISIGLHACSNDDNSNDQASSETQVESTEADPQINSPTTPPTTANGDTNADNDAAIERQSSEPSSTPQAPSSVPTANDTAQQASNNQAESEAQDASNQSVAERSESSDELRSEESPLQAVVESQPNSNIAVEPSNDNDNVEINSSNNASESTPTNNRQQVVTSQQTETTPAPIPKPAPPPPRIASNSGDIGGVVRSENGPEAGVWVVAETDDLDTFFAKIVVTDDSGRYLIPDLPEAEYQVWVRGYGLKDSTKTTTKPGRSINLTATPAANKTEAAQVYPAAYWYAMLNLPTEEETQKIDGGLNNYLTWVKNMGCVGCHQLGQLSTRTFPESFGNVSDHHAAWTQRIASGQAGQNMVGIINRLNGLPIKYFADWTERIAAGELPHETPERPQGKERNLVVTVRDWSNPKAYMHDLSGTDRRSPTVNSNGPLYGAPELSTDEFPILDPITNTASFFIAPARDEDTPSTVSTAPMSPSPYWGEEHIWDSKANAHNPMLDADGRVWYTARIRDRDNPDFCRKGSNHPSAELFPTEMAGRHLSVYEPDTAQYTFIDTCYSTHHLQFDANNILWTSGGGSVLGWLDVNKFLATGDAEASQGWSPLILDINANGKVDEWTEPGRRINTNKDARVNAGYYAVMPNIKDGSVWGSNAFSYPGAIVRYDPETGLGEKYNVPLPGFGSRGADIDKEGKIWVSLGSGHLGEFNRDKCKGPLNGPDATGDHCPEGWTFHRLPGPGFKKLPEQSVESSYYTFVDQHNTLGLGEDIPIATGNLFDGVHALVDNKFITLRVPYPMGFYTKGFEGRIDNPDAGWKGRGLWIPSGDRTPWLKEGGKGTRPLVVHMQMRPDPLAD